MSPRLVEVVGPAGAGKTTLVGRLVARQPGTRVGLAPSHLALASGLLAVSPTVAAARIRSGGRWFSRQELRSLAYLQAWQHAPGGASRQPPAGPVLLDHGPVYRLASLAAFGPPMTQAPGFTRWWSRTTRDWAALLDTVVWLDAPEQVLVARINGRPRAHRVRDAGAHEAAAFLARYRAAFDRALTEMATAGTRIVRLDTSARDPDELADAVAAQLFTAAEWSG